MIKPSRVQNPEQNTLTTGAFKVISGNKLSIPPSPKHSICRPSLEPTLLLMVQKSCKSHYGPRGFVHPKGGFSRREISEASTGQHHNAIHNQGTHSGSSQHRVFGSTYPSNECLLWWDFHYIHHCPWALKTPGVQWKSKSCKLDVGETLTKKTWMFMEVFL